jgi:hypothetical protein
MRGKVSITLALAALALGAIPPAGSAHSEPLSCGPTMSLLLWPKGYAGHPLPTFGIYRGLEAPYDLANELGTQTATGVATHAGALDPRCASYPGTARAVHTLIGHTVTGRTRLACTFPKPPAVFTEPRGDHVLRVRLVLPDGALVAEAMVKSHGSTLAYAPLYCSARQPLITPTSP